jgi:hypothetical protein
MRIHWVRSGAAVVLTLGAAFVGCANVTGYGACNGSYLGPSVKLLYPLPGATGVPDDAGVLVYGTAQNYLPATSVPIALRAGTASPIATVPTPVPNPYPSPAATGLNSVYAVALPTLDGGTTYKVLATVSSGNCYGPGTLVQEPIGSFTTQ